MRLIGKSKLEKLRRKNRGNQMLTKAIDKLIKDIEDNDWKNEDEFYETIVSADKVHSDGFYFIDISIHRTLVLIEFDDEGEATIVWVGNHQEYETVFKNNKNTIRKWLRSNEFIK